MHSRPSTNVSLLPWAVSETFSARVLKPSDVPTDRVALQHERAIIVADDNVIQTIAVDVGNDHSDRRVELSNDIFLPCYTLLLEHTFR